MINISGEIVDQLVELRRLESGVGQPPLVRRSAGETPPLAVRKWSPSAYSAAAREPRPSSGTMSGDG